MRRLKICLTFGLCVCALMLVSCADSSDGRLSRPGSPPSYPSSSPPDIPAEATVAGMPDDVKPVFAAKCAVCHGADARGKRTVPSLLEIADSHSPEEWAAYLRDPKVWDDENLMPVVRMTDDEIQSLAAWLATIDGTGGPTDAAGSASPVPDTEQGGD